METSSAKGARSLAVSGFLILYTNRGCKQGYKWHLIEFVFTEHPLTHEQETGQVWMGGSLAFHSHT